MNFFPIGDALIDQAGSVRLESRFAAVAGDALDLRDRLVSHDRLSQLIGDAKNLVDRHTAAVLL